MFSIPDQVGARLATGLCVALLTTGCGGRSPLPSTPSSSNVSANPAPVGPYTVSGIVADESGRPIAGARFDAFGLNGQTYSHWHLNDALVTNQSGHFQMTGISAGMTLSFRASKDGYVEQCAAPSVTVQGDVTINLPLVSAANLTASAPSAPGLRSLSGTVVTAGKQPVAGVGVWFEAFEDFEPATTYSDQAGRFALCGLPVDQTVHLQASIGSRGVNLYVPPGQTATNLEIVLP